jgi:hypothetical protein
MTRFAQYISAITTSLVIAIGATLTAQAQALVDPYPFAFGSTVDIDTALLGPVEPAGSRGRVAVSTDGAFVTADGERLRFYGVTIQYSGCLPDSATAVATARRLRALGVNMVRFTAFDYTPFPAISIFAEGTRTSALDPARMRRFDWLVYQLKQQGIYSVPTFYSVWQPRPDDGVRQPDSVGWGARVPVFFDKTVQQIHRSMVRMVLEHVNPFTGTAYKNEPAIPYIIPFEDASLGAYWLYSKDVSRNNPNGSLTLGSQHLALIDSLFIVSLKAKGAVNDAALRTRWSTSPASTDNRLKNGGFEDPFSAAWNLGVNANGGAQAIGQISDADAKEGTSCYRLRIGKLGEARQAFEINLLQSVSPLPRDKRYRVSFWARTTPQRGQRSVLVYVYNGTYPYNNYGLNSDITLSGAWQKFDMSFTSTATDEATANLSFFCGADSGDVFVDDVQFVETGHVGLENGESIATGAVRRNLFWEEDISPARMRDVAGFYREQLQGLFDGVRRLVRDTLRSDVLLCPSASFVSYWEQVAADSYDITSSTEWRSTQVPLLTELYGAGVPSHAQFTQAGKPHVVHHATIQFPRSYQNDMMTFLPSYAGLHDWDGIVQGVFTGSSAWAADRVDSAQIWELYNKPNILALMPSTALRFRRGDVVSSPKTLSIAVSDGALDYPRKHVQPFFLDVYSDQRMPLFRRVAIARGTSSQGSFLPHREISILNGDVDIRAMDAENEQLFWNADLGVHRVITPKSVSVSGRLQGEIHELGTIRVEQTAGAAYAAFTLTSLDTASLETSSRALMVVATRALNEGAEFDPATNELSRYGRGQTQMEGAVMRITMPSAGADSLVVRALGSDGRPTGWTRSVAASGTGRFSVSVNTREAVSPWYDVTVVRTPTSVRPDGSVTVPLVHDASGRRVRVVSEDVRRIDIVGVDGTVIRTSERTGGTEAVELAELASGVYYVRAHMAAGVGTLPILHVR